MNKLDFCPECGTKLTDSDEFCPNCGLDLKKYVQENVKPEAEKVVEQPKVQKSQPVAPKKKNHFMPIIILVIILIAGYFGGKMYYSQDRQEQTLQDEVTSGKTSRMQAALVDEKGKSLSTDQVAALKRLYLKEGAVIRDIESQISANQSNQAFQVKQTGKYFMLYPKYKISVKTRGLAVETNISNPSISVDGKSVAVKSSNGEYKVSNLTPGVYDVKVVNSKKSSESKQEQIIIGTDNKEASIEMNIQKAEEAPKVITKVVHDRDTTSSDTNNNDTSDNSSSSDNSLVGRYEGSPDLALYSDGTYDLGGKSGTYDIVENNNGHVKIRYNQDGGGSIVESYDYANGELHSSKYDQSWYKE